YRLRRADGAWISVRHTMEPLRAERDAEVRRWFTTIQDVTEQREAEEKIERLNRVYAVLSQINGLIVRVANRDELFREAARIAVEQGQFCMAWVGAVDREAMRIKPLAWAGEVRDFFDTAPLTGPDGKGSRQGLAWRAAVEKQPMISNDIQADAQTIMKAQCMERGINSLAMLPLVVAGEGIGVLALYAGEIGFFDDQEMKLLVELASDISFALEHIENSEKLDYLAF